MVVLTKLTFFALLIIPALGLCACTQKAADNQPQLQIVEHAMSFHNFGDVLKSIVAVDGKARNIGSTTIGDASITVNFYDKDNNLLYTTSAAKKDLAVDELWYFNIRFVSPDAWKTVRYDISATAK